LAGFYYAATPYSLYPYGRENAFKEACYLAAFLMTKGVMVFSPIAHSHPIADAADLDPVDHEFWIAIDRPLMEAAQGLIVCQMQGWEESRGVRAEIDYFQQARKPIVYWNPLSAVPEELISG
jgi:hypothetical protein